MPELTQPGRGQPRFREKMANRDEDNRIYLLLVLLHAKCSLNGLIKRGFEYHQIADLIEKGFIRGMRT